MAQRFYITPIQDTGLTYPDVSKIPAYIEAEGGRVLEAMTYGREPYMLVRADVTTLQNTAISLHTDVIVIPANLDNLIAAGALATVQASLETIGVPASWVTTAFSYRQVLRTVGGLFQFAQRYAGLFNLNLFRGGVTLNTTFNQLPNIEQQRLIDCADSFGYDRSSLSGTSTIRQILKTMADQWRGNPLMGL